MRVPLAFLLVERGYRTFNELLEASGADTAGLSLVATAMSNDAQAFTGLADDTETWEERPFYATLPKRTYDWALP